MSSHSLLSGKCPMSRSRSRLLRPKLLLISRFVYRWLLRTSGMHQLHAMAKLRTWAPSGRRSSARGSGLAWRAAAAWRRSHPRTWQGSWVHWQRQQCGQGRHVLVLDVQGDGGDGGEALVAQTTSEGRPRVLARPVQPPMRSGHTPCRRATKRRGPRSLPFLAPLGGSCCSGRR